MAKTTQRESSKKKPPKKLAKGPAKALSAKKTASKSKRAPVRAVKSATERGAPKKPVALQKAPFKAKPNTSLYAGNADLPFDAAAALEHLHGADELLSRLILRVHDHIGPFSLQPQGHDVAPFQALTEAILHQQVTGKAAAAILGRFRAAFGKGDAFPTPLVVSDASDEALRAVGISRSKAAALRDLAAKSIDGTVPHAKALMTMEEEAIIERLTKVRGIGEWTVHMLLIFRLGRPDILPVGDYGVRKGFARTFRTKTDLATAKEIEARAERWKPYRTVASWYLWRALELSS